MIELSVAVKLAKEKVVEIFSSEHVRDLLLEEVDYAGKWIVTVSFVREQFQAAVNPIISMGEGMRRVRVFKSVHIDSETGALIKIVDRPSSLAA
jgi:hypothetical protein